MYKNKNIKSILLVGSSGYIGSNIYRELLNNNNPKYKIIRYSSTNKIFLDACNIQKFDYMIFAAGVHPKNNYVDNKIFLQNRKIIKTLNYFLILTS